MDQLDLSNLIKEIKALRRDMRKIRQTLEDPTGEKAKERSKNNGFNKPQKISEKLRAFLSLGPDELMSRSQVTRKINEYVEAKGLKNGQKISLDSSLRDLLVVPEGTDVTFLNIQKFINPHYIKETKTVEPVVVAEVPKEKKMRPKVAVKQ